MHTRFGHAVIACAAWRAADQKGHRANFEFKSWRSLRQPESGASPTPGYQIRCDLDNRGRLHDVRIGSACCQESRLRSAGGRGGRVPRAALGCARWSRKVAIMATYTREDFEQIAAAIRKDVTHVCRHEKQFEAAAMWYRLGQNALKNQRTTPFVMRQRMTQIVNAARKLLRHLGVWDPAQAPDGPSIAVLQVLASTCDVTEDAVVRATAR
jgi:hypothetical protein